jgi:DNA-binding response OmpR family regulator
MATRPTPIVMLTAFTERELIDAALEAGASGYLVKPISDEQLEPAITVALRCFANLLMRHYHLSESEAHRRLYKDAPGTAPTPGQDRRTGFRRSRSIGLKSPRLPAVFAADTPKTFEHLTARP